MASKLTPASQETPPRTSPARRAQSTSVSVLRTSPWTEPTHPSEGGQQTVNTDRLPELLAGTTAVPGSAGTTHPALGKKLSHPVLSCPISPSCSLQAHVRKRNPPLTLLYQCLSSPASLKQEIKMGTAWVSHKDNTCHWHMFF